tara:strand:+ start:1077 stop:1400 length:324 start_codon:yes stop_codon:yes gene_type:complete
MKKILTVILLAFFTHTAWAIELGAAKAQGLVGEARTGYVAAVKPPASGEVSALIKEVNAKRKAQFQNAAQRTGTTLKQVSNRFYEIAVQRTASGHYYQDGSGAWKRK